LTFSPGECLRKVRLFSVLDAVKGACDHVVEQKSGELAHSLADSLAEHQLKIEEFVRTGSLRLSAALGSVWNSQFPMILPPHAEGGLGVAILNSNAETHFSFTNALGMITAEQMHRLAMAIGRLPRAFWIIGLHHHLMEYPMPVSAYSERIGTALINGSWFVRKLRPFAQRCIAMHGHRHIDWIGACEGLKIVSAPSPVMGVRDDQPT